MAGINMMDTVQFPPIVLIVFVACGTSLSLRVSGIVTSPGCEHVPEIDGNNNSSYVLW